MEFRTANPSPFKVLERLLQIDHRENEFVCKFSITLGAEHIKRIFEDSSLEIPRCELLPPSPPPLSTPLTRFETSWREDKLINYETYFPIQ